LAGFYIPSATEPLAGSPRLLSEPAMFLPGTGEETKLGRDETIFAAREDIRKRALDID
jgi:hypothetical protein